MAVLAQPPLARKLRRFLEPLRRFVVAELVGEPETLIVDSTLLSVLHPRQVKQSAGGFDGAASWVRWGSFSVYGVKLHLLLLCASNGVPVAYELTPANVAEVRLMEELLAEAGLWGRRWDAGCSATSWPTGARSWSKPWPSAGSCW